MKKILLVLGLAILVASASYASVFGVDVGGTPYMGFQLNENQRVDVGLMYISNNDGATTNLGIFGRFDNKIAEVDKLNLSWAGQLGITSAAAAGATTTTIVLTGLLSAEYKITDVVALYGNIYLLTLQSVGAGGASATSFGVLTGDGQAYSGIRIYI